MKYFVSIVIVHWNTSQSLRKLLKQLDVDRELQIIVVDNASRESVDWIREEFPNVELINNKRNTGYAAACNQGIKKSKGDWISFLNPDVSIEKNSIFESIDQAEEKKLDAFSIITAKDYRKPLPSALSLLAEFTPLKYLIPLLIFRKKTLTGGLLFIKKNILKEVGGWDERFFLWFEDSDLTKRLYDRGYQVGWVKSDVKHIGGESFQQLDDAKKRKLFFRSMETYARKNLGIIGNTVVQLLQKQYVS